MKLALKVVAAVVLGLFAVLSAFGYLRFVREVALFESDMRRDHELIGRTLAVGVVAARQAADLAAALALVERSDAAQPDLQIGFIRVDGSRAGRARVRFRPPERLAGEVAHQLVAADDGPEWLVSWVPVVDGGELLGRLEIAESLAQRDAYVRKSIRNTLFATLVTGLLSAALVLLLGLWLIGRPLDRLAQKARRIGEGDLTGPLNLGQRDEVGELAREVNAMCERLSEATAHARFEEEARMEALEQLRHADRLRTVGQLAAGVAHELGTPLNVVSGRAQMIQKGGLDAGTLRSYAEVIQEQTARMAGIVRQLLDLARHRSPVRVACDLAATAQSACQLLSPLADKKRVRLALSTSPAATVGDPGQLEQVTTNLVVNAIHASPEGAVVEISTGRELVPTNADDEPTQSERAFLRVRDVGHGMTPATVKRIFEPFFTTKDIGQGSGLGLSVAHGIVAEHGGAVEVETGPSRGATFSVYLPLAS